MVQEYVYPDARDRQFLITLHKEAKKRNLDVAHYNRLKDAVAQAEYDLKRLRDPLTLHIPISHMSKDIANQNFKH